MNMSDVTESKQVKAKDPVKKAKGIQKSHPYKGKLVGESGGITEAPLVLNNEGDLLRMLDYLLLGWKNKKHTDDEYAQLLRALGYKMDKTGDRTVLVKEAFKNTYDVGDRVDGPLGTGTIVAVSKNVNVDGKVKVKLDDPSKAGKDGEDRDSFVLLTTQLQHINELEEAPGAIRKGMAAVALIAGLWGVNNHMAQKAYDASPQLQKLTAYLEVAKEHNDQRMIDQLESRIEAHKFRIDMGKGEVMGKDGMPVDVKYDKEANESTGIPFNQCPSCGGEIVHVSEAEGKKDACYHKVKSRYKVWPSAYASGALVQCRKKGAKNWGNSSKK